MTFVDYGSGKGRVLFLAALHGFDRVIGVEYSEELHNAALENCRKFSRTDLVDRIEPVLMDAADFRIPETDCLLNFYNPLPSDIFNKVMARVGETSQRCGNRIVVSFQESFNEHPDVRTTNIETLKSLPFMKPLEPKFVSGWDRFLLSIYRIQMAQTF